MVHFVSFTLLKRIITKTKIFKCWLRFLNCDQFPNKQSLHQTDFLLFGFRLIKSDVVTSLLLIGEYSARKIYFFPNQQKNCEKISHYFSLSEIENCPKLHFLGKNC